MNTFDSKTLNETLSIIQSYYNGDEFVREISNFDKLIEFASLHQLDGIISFVLLASKIKIDETTTKKLKKIKITQIRNGIITSELANKINSQLESIPHAFFKGIIIKDIYQPHELRSMGDIDIYVPFQYLKTLQDKFIELGYSTPTYYNEVYSFNGTPDIEVHTNIKWFNNYIVNEEDIANNSFDIYTNTKILIYHTIKHISIYGCGIRQILDIALWYRNYYQVIDINRLQAELKKDNLVICYNYILSIVNRWFKTAYPTTNVDEDSLYVFENSILLGGVFGMNLTNRRTFYEIKYNNGKRNFLKSIFLVAFPPYEHMLLTYPELKNKKYLLVPRYFTRINNIIFKHKNIDKVGEFISSKSTTKERKILLEILGLDKTK